jgi:lipopolysaccharide heptosyltransferase II
VRVTVPEAESGLTILQVLSWLNYGGVESYAIRLGRALHDRGHRVVVASSGGQLVPDLEAAGIEHVTIDFTGLRTLAGLRALRCLLEREHVDLVNAHNWRAGMVSHLACRQAGVPYVLTIHGTRNPMHRHAVFYWSDRVIVVSEASRRNLVEGFGLPAERVARTMIGVDGDRFRPSPADASLEAELGLRSGAPRVVHISRFSHSKVGVALALVAAMPALAQAAPGIELLLVGQGPEEKAVAAAAAEMNQRLGRRAVFALGGRGDIPHLLSLGTVVVATATVALEAMASGKPVVAAGKGGYLGIVRPEDLTRAEDSCFADHEEMEPVTPERLAQDVEVLLADSDEAARLGERGRLAAASRYSPALLAEEVESVYRQVLCERARVRQILVFHLNQIGDLVFTLPALKALREAFPDARITSVLRPHLSALVSHSGFVDRIVHRTGGKPWSAVSLGLQLRRLRPDLAVAFSQSATMTLCAWLSGARHRVGYVDSDLSRLLNHRIQVRGIPSPAKVVGLARSLGLSLRKTDYVGLLTLAESDREAGAALLANCELAAGGPLVALAPAEAGERPYKSWTEAGFIAVASTLAQEHDARFLVVGAERDRALGNRLVAGLADRACNLAGRTTPSQLAAVLSHCDLLIGIDSGPMHVAAAMGRPVVGIFGPTDPARTGPLGRGHEIILHQQPCAPCMTPTCSDRPCLSSITVDEVVSAARRILARTSEAR